MRDSIRVQLSKETYSSFRESNEVTCLSQTFPGPSKPLDEVDWRASGSVECRPILCRYSFRTLLNTIKLAGNFLRCSPETNREREARSENRCWCSSPLAVLRWKAALAVHQTTLCRHDLRPVSVLDPIGRTKSPIRSHSESSDKSRLWASRSRALG